MYREFSMPSAEIYSSENIKTKKKKEEEAGPGRLGNEMGGVRWRSLVEAHQLFSAKCVICRAEE